MTATIVNSITVSIAKSITIGSTALTLMQHGNEWWLIDNYEITICDTYEKAYSLFKNGLHYHVEQERIVDKLVNFVNVMLRADEKCDLTTEYDIDSEMYCFVDGVYSEAERQIDRRKVDEWYHALAIEYLEEILFTAFNMTETEVVTVKTGGRKYAY